jgi:16S rRNA (guanine966-N2)-methyltransferase
LGAVGLEARSRGAEPVVAVESDHRTARLVQSNARDLGLPVQVHARPVERVLELPPSHPFDVVFADPPYALGEDALADVLTRLVTHRWLLPGADVVVERSARSVEPAWPSGLSPVREKRYGETVLWYVRAATPESPIQASAEEPRSR